MAAASGSRIYFSDRSGCDLGRGFAGQKGRVDRRKPKDTCWVLSSDIGVTASIRYREEGHVGDKATEQ